MYRPPKSGNVAKFHSVYVSIDPVPTRSPGKTVNVGRSLTDVARQLRNEIANSGIALHVRDHRKREGRRRATSARRAQRTDEPHTGRSHLTRSLCPAIRLVVSMPMARVLMSRGNRRRLERRHTAPSTAPATTTTRPHCWQELYRPRLADSSHRALTRSCSCFDEQLRITDQPSLRQTICGHPFDRLRRSRRTLIVLAWQDTKGSPTRMALTLR